MVGRCVPLHYCLCVTHRGFDQDSLSALRIPDFFFSASLCLDLGAPCLSHSIQLCIIRTAVFCGLPFKQYRVPDPDFIGFHCSLPILVELHGSLCLFIILSSLLYIGSVFSWVGSQIRQLCEA